MSDAALSDSLAAGAAATAAPPPLPALVVRARSVGAVSLLVVAMVAKMDDRWVGLMGTAAADDDAAAAGTLLVSAAPPPPPPPPPALLLCV